MRKCLFHTGLLLLLLGTLPALAQPNQTQAVDTLITVTEVGVSENSDTTRFDPIGQQAVVAVRQVPQRLLDSLKTDDDYWYANATPVKKDPVQDTGKNKKTWFQEKWFRTLLWFVIISSFIGVVIWYLVSGNILIFRKKARNIAVEAEEEAITDDIFSIRYDHEIAKAANAGNFRLAVRLWYLYVLKELAEKGYIDYRHGRTNHDYVLQLHKSPHYRDFSRLTRNFEYTWYGQFDLSAEAYEWMRNDFSTFKNALRR